MSFKLSILKILLLIVISALNLSAEKASEHKDGLKMAITGLSGLEQLERDFGAFQDALNKASGMKIKFFPLSNRTVIVQSLKAKHVDLVLFGPAEYAVTRSKLMVKPIAALSRTDYFSAIVTLSNKNINSIPLHFR